MATSDSVKRSVPPSVVGQSHAAMAGSLFVEATQRILAAKARHAAVRAVQVCGNVMPLESTIQDQCQVQGRKNPRIQPRDLRTHVCAKSRSASTRVLIESHKPMFTPGMHAPTIDWVRPVDIQCAGEFFLQTQLSMHPCRYYRLGHIMMGVHPRLATVIGDMSKGPHRKTLGDHRP